MTHPVRAFAEAGHGVFMLEPIIRNPFTQEPQCGCGNPKCKNAGKHPTADNWQKPLPLDEDRIEGFEMLVEEMGRGYGILCQNLLVIDVDVRNGGAESFEALCEQFPSILGAGLIVKTGRGDGSKHLFFNLPADVRIKQNPKNPDKSPVFPGIDFKHSGFVVGAGSPHASGGKYEIVSGSVDEIDDAPADLVDFLKYEPLVIEHDGRSVEVSDDFLISLLESISVAGCDYEEWLHVGMALHHATSGSSNGLAMWHNWTSASEHYDPKGIDMRWHGFGKSGGTQITVGTLIKMAREQGWKEPVSDRDVPLQGWLAEAYTGSSLVTPKTPELIEESHSPLKGAPVDIRRIDLTRPPGFVGRVAEWINSQCLYPRENLAAMGALFAVSTAAGLRYMEGTPQRTRTNLMLFCVAGSATGKDAVLTAVRDLLHVSGFSSATHGGIKSDREILQNLLRHQAAIYTIDEIGGRLAKISRSKKGTGASYLDGVMETLMEVYTKAGTHHVLTGDAKEDLEKMLRARLADCKQRIENNEDDSGAAALELASVEKRLAMNGRLERPFVSLMGFTTPSQFASVMSVENAETGFLGRAILCVETNDNPEMKKDFAPRDLPPSIEMQLQQLAGGTSFENSPYYRVEHYGEVEAVYRTPAAQELLTAIQEWIHSYTEYQSQVVGQMFTPLYRRVFEKVVKVALVLGVADGEIDVEHVEWAFAAAIRDLHEKISAIKLNDEGFSKSDKLVEAIMAGLRAKPGSTSGVLFARSAIRLKFQREDLEKALKHLVVSKAITAKEETHARNGTKVVRYYVK